MDGGEEEKAISHLLQINMHFIFLFVGRFNTSIFSVFLGSRQLQSLRINLEKSKMIPINQERFGS